MGSTSIAMTGFSVKELHVNQGTEEVPKWVMVGVSHSFEDPIIQHDALWTKPMLETGPIKGTIKIGWMNPGMWFWLRGIMCPGMDFSNLRYTWFYRYKLKKRGYYGRKGSKKSKKTVYRRPA